MKTLKRILSMIAICMVASMQLSSCSSSDDDEPEVKKTYTIADVSGKWMTMVVQPLDDMSFEEAKKFAMGFQTPYIELTMGGKLIWYELDSATGTPIKVQHTGTFTVKDDQITLSAPGNKWMNGTHTINVAETGHMEWTVKTSDGLGKFYFGPTVYTNLPEVDNE